MDERYLLTAVLMVIGLQFGESIILTVTHCKSLKESKWNKLDGVNITGGTYMKTYNEYDTMGGNAARCFSYCSVDEDCFIAVMDDNKQCMTYSYNGTVDPAQVSVPLFTSWSRVIVPLYDIAALGGSFTFPQAKNVCTGRGKKLPKIDSEAKMTALVQFINGHGLSSANRINLFWSQAVRTSAATFYWEDGIELTPPPFFGCIPENYFWYDCGSYTSSTFSSPSHGAVFITPEMMHIPLRSDDGSTIVTSVLCE